MSTIGIFEAKTRLSEIVRKVDQGERFTITVRGRAVADVVPTQQPNRKRVAEAVQRLLDMPKIEGISHEQIRAWIEEGRE
jgi:prevent-host-death family protein